MSRLASRFAWSKLAIVALFTSNAVCADLQPTAPVQLEYTQAGTSEPVKLPLADQKRNESARISVYKNQLHQVVLHEIDRRTFTEINGHIESLAGTSSGITLRVTFPLKGKTWVWFSGLDRSSDMEAGKAYSDTVSTKTTIPPAGAFNGKDLSAGGYGDPVGTGTMSYYPLCALGVDNKGEALGIDMSLPVVYRLAAAKDDGLTAELDLATSPLTRRFPNRAFFKLSRFGFAREWGMRAALKAYYAIHAEAFKKRVVNEGIWLPFTPLRSIPNWEEFGFAFHETSFGSSDLKDGVKMPNITSDRGTGVQSFQYTEPWDVQIPVKSTDVPYSTIVTDQTLPAKDKSYLETSAAMDKNGLWQARRLETPWFKTGWAVSITTNCDPELPGYNRYRFVRETEIDPAIGMNVDGIYFDSMEWNWHHDLNYNESHFAFTDYPLSFSSAVGKPAIWNLVSEFEFMSKISDEMHRQGKLAMGNGHGWNPFVASILDAFGAELSWYATDDHNVAALDFKRAISYQKPIVFLLNEGLDDKAFTEAPYKGYELYFEKMMAYGFFPSFFSVDASNNPYWKDRKKIENGRPFFKKYIPLIKEISAAGWEPVTAAKTSTDGVRIERFGEKGTFYFTLRNNGAKDEVCTVILDVKELGIKGRLTATEKVTGKKVEVRSDRITIELPSGRTRVLQIEAEAREFFSIYPRPTDSGLAPNFDWIA